MTPVFNKEKLEKMLINKNYCFEDSFFEPSSTEPIDEDKLNLDNLRGYLNETYKSGEKPYIHQKTIEKIINTPHAQKCIKQNKSEYYKVLTHFTILSKVKRGWVNLFSNSSTGTSKPSLSDTPSRHSNKNAKLLNDAIIHCFYSRLIEGMTEQDRSTYEILLPSGYNPSGFDSLLYLLGKTIQDLFCIQERIFFISNDNVLSLYTDFENISDSIRQVIIVIFSQNTKDGCDDPLRATLLKFASINRAINCIDAVINIINKVIETLPDNNIGHLLNINSESEILPTILDIFNVQITKVPIDLIDCSKLVCKLYIMTNLPCETPRYKHK